MLRKKEGPGGDNRTPCLECGAGLISQQHIDCINMRNNANRPHMNCGIFYHSQPKTDYWHGACAGMCVVFTHLLAPLV
jgi:hypothetical protein